MKITTCSCTSVALLFLAPFVRGQAAAGGGVVVQSAPAATMVWSATTNIAGVAITQQVPFIQQFSSYTVITSVPSSGVIGLGPTITGAIGVTKTVAPQKRDVQYTQAPIAQQKQQVEEKQETSDGSGMSGKEKVWMTIATAGVVSVLGIAGVL